MSKKIANMNAKGDVYMDPLSLAPLAISTWNLLAPYAKKISGKILEKAGESLPDLTGKIWDMVKKKLETQEETKTLPADLIKTPDDLDVQGAFRYQLKKLLENDQVFAQEIEKLMSEARKSTTNAVSVEGDGAAAVGDHAMAIGKGGTYIDGSVSGSTVISGNDNTVGSIEKDRKKKKTLYK
jgi:hypothetical protein